MSRPRPIASTVEDALTYTRELSLPTGVAFAPLDALDANDAEHDAEPPPAFVITALATGPVPMSDAVAIWRTFRDRREESGLTPVIVDADAWEHLRAYRDEWAWPDAVSLAVDAAAVDAEAPAEYFSRHGGGGEFASVVRAAIETLEARYGRGLTAHEGLLDFEAMQTLEGNDADDPDDAASDEDPDELEDEADDLEDELEDELDAPGADAPPGSEGARGALAGGSRLTVALAPAVAPAMTEADALDALARGGDPAHVVLLACPPHMTLYYLGFGGWNDCPTARKHAVLWKYWGTRHGAEVVRVGPAGVDAVVARPVATLADLARAIHEIAAYSQDSLVEGVLPLAATLFRSHAWSVWWD